MTSTVARTALVVALIATAPAHVAAQGASSDLGFAVPAGYAQQRQGDVIILAPAAPRSVLVHLRPRGAPAATGPLDAAAEAALVQLVVPGWRGSTTGTRRCAAPARTAGPTPGIAPPSRGR